MDLPSLLIHWIHVLAAAMWVGSLMFLAFVLAPALRSTLPDSQRLDFVDSLGRRVNYFGFISLALLASTGIYNMFHHINPFTQMLTTTYGSLLLLKISLFSTIFVLAGVHAFIYGPRQTALARSLASNPNASILLRRERRRSIMVSAANLTVSLAALFVAVALGRL